MDKIMIVVLKLLCEGFTDFFESKKLIKAARYCDQ